MQLYALCDQGVLDRRGVSIETFVDICKKNSASIIQYRNKTADLATLKSQLILLRQLFDGYLIVNDAYELIEYCDGVHMGQEDLAVVDPDISKAVAIVREIIGKGKLLGISTHNADEIAVANDLDLNYIGLGAYRNTTTKAVPNLLGETLDTLAKESLHPVAAIGGVKRDDTFLHVSYLVIGSGLFED
jgi:thiamine-phosphate pyrophosphorylase